jgi:hypothetical protein
MIEKTDWEVVDGLSPSPGSARPESKQHLLRTLLGPWWRWKIAALATVGGVVLLFFAAFTGMILLFMLAAAGLAIGIGKLRRWLRGSRAPSSLNPASRTKPPVPSGGAR